MKRLFGLAMTAALVAGTAQAQERTAGQANDAQVNWAALSAKLDAIDSQNKILAASITTMQASITSMTTCASQQKIWNGTSCSPAIPTAPRVVQTLTSVPRSGGYATATCASDEVLVGGGGRCESNGTINCRLNGSEPIGVNGWRTGGWADAGNPQWYVYAYCQKK